jgi:hypothetical protein
MNNPHYYIEEFFRNHKKDLSRVIELSLKVKEGIEEIDPFIHQNTSVVCPECEKVCCINRHAYYNSEDLIYIYALGLTPHEYKPVDDKEPCRFLGEKGCRLERSLRPSGCNWYFCGPLYDSMEKTPLEYEEFDEAWRELAETWMEMIKEFRKQYHKITGVR